MCSWLSQRRKAAAVASPAEFKKRMHRLGVAVADGADKVVRKVAMVADQTVVMATPVDKGRARANWIAALDAPNTTTTEAVSPSGAEAIAQAAGVVAQYDGDKHQAIHITNNLSYIRPLNEGSSKQAPAQFVEQAVEKAVGAIRGARIIGS